MRYTERDLKTKYTSFMDYIESVVELLLLSPLRLINEISKKVVYLQKKRIEKLLIVAIVIAALIIVIESLIQLTLNNLYLIGGPFSILFQLIALFVICIIYGFIRNYDFSISEQMESVLQAGQNLDKEIENNFDETIKDNFNEGVKDKFDEGSNMVESEKYTKVDLSFKDVSTKDFTENLHYDFNINEEDVDLSDLPTNDFNDFNDFSKIAGITGTSNILDDIAKADEMDESEESEMNLNVSNNISPFSTQELNPITEENFRQDELFNDELDLSEYDCANHNVTEFINNDLLENQKVIDYKNRHSTAVEKLKERDKTLPKASLFSTEELEIIQKMCDQAIKESKFVDDDIIQIALKNQKYDDFSQVDNFMENDNVDWLQNI